jgi:hypothetical protein
MLAGRGIALPRLGAYGANIDKNVSMLRSQKSEDQKPESPRTNCAFRLLTSSTPDSHPHRIKGEARVV